MIHITSTTFSTLSLDKNFAGNKTLGPSLLKIKKEFILTIIIILYRIINFDQLHHATCNLHINNNYR